MPTWREPSSLASSAFDGLIVFIPDSSLYINVSGTNFQYLESKDLETYT